MEGESSLSVETEIPKIRLLSLQSLNYVFCRAKLTFPNWEGNETGPQLGGVAGAAPLLPGGHSPAERGGGRGEGTLVLGQFSGF